MTRCMILGTRPHVRPWLGLLVGLLCIALPGLSQGANTTGSTSGSGDNALPTSSGDMNVGNVVYTVTDVGAHGWFDPQAGQNMGSGFVFGGGGNALFHAGLIVATATDDVADACYGSDDNGATTPFDGDVWFAGSWKAASRRGFMPSIGTGATKVEDTRPRVSTSTA